MWVGLATQVKTLRLPEDVVETINDFPGSTFTEKFVAAARLLGRDPGTVSREVERNRNPESGGYECFASMFVRQVRQCFSAVWADGFPRCRHRFPVM